MYDYKEMRAKHGNEIGQTIDAPIRFMDHFDLVDVGISLLIILIFGIMLYSWWTMLFLLILNLGLLPYLKKKYNRGFLLHWPYRYLGISLPGLFNPGKDRKYSD